MKEVILVPTYKREPHLFCCLKRLRAQDSQVPIFVFSDRGERGDELSEICRLFQTTLIDAGESMKEVIIVPTYRRPELLHCCLKRLITQDQDVPIFVFSDRGDESPLLFTDYWNTKIIIQPKHDYHGNSFNAGEALRFAYNAGYDLIHYCEDDTFVKPGWLAWTREMHAELDETFSLFASCGWVFNHHMPFSNESYLAPWIYIPQFSITRKKLELVMPHLNPFYYRDMCKYIQENFTDNAINKLYPDVVHYEIDGLLQRVLMDSRTQSVWCATTKVDHFGAGGYNRGWENYENLFIGCNDSIERVDRLEELYKDIYWRAETFGRSHVEREVGHPIPKRTYKYRITLPGGWSTEADSELGTLRPTMKVKSVRLPRESIIEKIVMEG